MYPFIFAACANTVFKRMDEDRWGWDRWSGGPSSSPGTGFVLEGGGGTHCESQCPSVPQNFPFPIPPTLTNLH